MYNLIIVDDEKRVRKALKMSVDWEKYNIQVIAEAEDGDIALELIQKHPVDIIITDIYMARIDGLKLIKEAQKIIPHVKSIILSGYDDFDYVQKAIRNKAFDYLLKPIQFDKLSEILTKLTEKIKKEREQRKNYKVYQEQLEQFKPMIKERFLDYLLAKRLSFQKMKTENNYLDFNLNDNNFVVIAIEFKCKIKAIERLGIKDTLKNELLKEYKKEIIDSYPDKYIIILNYDQSKTSAAVNRELVQAAKRIIIYSMKIFNRKLTIGIGNLYQDPEQISSSYKEALEALEYQIFYGAGEVYLFKDFNPQKDKKLNYPFKIEEEIITALKIGDSSNINQKTKKFFLFHDNLDKKNPDFLKRSCLQLIYSLSKMAVEWNYHLEILELENKIQNCNNLNELENYIMKFIEQISESVSSRKKIEKENYIKSVCDYIDNNYYNDLSLDEIADHVYLSPNYLANIFKERMDKTILNYLTEIRIKKAKELLLNSQLKIYEISEKIGYKSSNYFSQVFKKHTGYSPVEYRQNNF
ncbi:AraC family two component transcriptional regulator [Halanaerobium saccharolyticum]|uniref:Stage 0 sporulation protein A homolog n=1 Tax=Halanaerobium saccharolyticum TaxID=43595 RepID=A0A4R7Z898_9FIRM|nr:response regulator [Halanaerobium saccharolyticum]RAK07832.1 AraC family two component transcriptional regulator [Halanaerobium saccharolyticum]TDW04446.1 AraC family two component transcriptional regulator [Halanaerobium saccharolyticum]TDX59782.1 AraC family two component transcriptional regulator [Halanaerobium saccharolyticum]